MDNIRLPGMGSSTERANSSSFSQDSVQKEQKKDESKTKQKDIHEVDKTNKIFSDSVSTQNKSLVSQKNGNRDDEAIKLCEEKCQGTKEIQEIQELKESLPKDEKKEAFKKCLISNQYLMMYKMLNTDDLSEYTSFELNIICNMSEHNKDLNPTIEQDSKKSIMKELFGEEFYETNIAKLQNEIDKLLDEDKKKQLVSVNEDLFIEMKNNGCDNKVECMNKAFEMVRSIYSNEIMKGEGLEVLANNNPIEFCFAKSNIENAVAFQSPHDNIVSMISSCQTWKHLEEILADENQEARSFESNMRHELTHYTQDLLISLSDDETLSSQAKEAIELFGQAFPDHSTEDYYKKYILHAEEMGARTTEILSQLEKTCGLEYGDFCFQDKGTAEARKEHAKKIVDKLDKYLQQEKGQSLAQFLNTTQISPEGGITRHGFNRLLDLFTFNVHDDDGKVAMFEYDENLQLSSEQLASSDANEHIAKCFEHLLTYIIPREDMRKIAQELGSQDMTFIESEKIIGNQDTLNEQIEACEAQIQLFESLQKKMQRQDGSIPMPSIDYLSSQIEKLENDEDVKKYKEAKTKLEEAQASNEDTEELLKWVDEYATLPVVESYIHFNELKNQSQLIDLQEKLANVKFDDIQKAKQEIESIKAQILKFGYDDQKKIIEDVSKQMNKLEENVKVKNMSVEDRKRYVKENNLEVQDESKLLSDINGEEARIKLLTSITNGAQDIHESRDSLKDVFKDDKINEFIQSESTILSWYNKINSVKNDDVQKKIKYFRLVSLSKWLNDKGKKVLAEYKNNALSKPNEENKLFNNVLEVFNELYNNAKEETNNTILANPNNTNKIGELIKESNTKLDEFKEQYNKKLNETIDKHAIILKDKINQKHSINEKITKYRSEKNTMEDMKNQMSKIMYLRYEQERARNDRLYYNLDKDVMTYCRDTFVELFSKLKDQLESLPQGIQSKLKLYSNWARRGYDKFYDWTKALTK